MTKPIYRLSLALAAALLAGAAAAAPQPADDSISARVQERLAQDSQLTADDIVVETRDGIVHMEGKVSSADSARRAIQLAEATDGVRGVWVSFEEKD